jgi:hypothetical protein
MFVVLEGGYNLDALAKSSEAVIKALMLDSTNKDEVNSLIKQLYDGSYFIRGIVKKDDINFDSISQGSLVAPRECFEIV